MHMVRGEIVYADLFVKKVKPSSDSSVVVVMVVVIQWQVIAEIVVEVVVVGSSSSSSRDGPSHPASGPGDRKVNDF